MFDDTKFWRRHLPLHRQGDPHEIAARLRLVVDAEPFASTPRHWLARLHRELGQAPLALVHYEKLLTQAVGDGELFRAVAAQKRIEELLPRPGAERRLAALHRWFRLLGYPGGSESRGGLTARTLLRIPVAAFVDAVLGSRLEAFDRASAILAVAPHDQRVVLWGELVWDLRLPDGRTTKEARSIAGDHVWIDPGVVAGARLRVRPETPCECLCFGGNRVRRVIEADASAHALGFEAGEIVREERALLPTRPLAPSDIDRRPLPPERAASGPPTLSAGDGREARAAGDTGDWVEFGTLTLDLEPLRLAGTDESATATDDLPTIDLPLAPIAGRAERLPRLSTPSEVAPDHGLVVPPVRDPWGAAGGDRTGHERRRSGRVPFDAAATVRLLGLGASADLPCAIFDLAPGGIGVRFERERVVHLLPLLERETLRIEWVVPGREPLCLAAHLRWADLGEPGQVSAGLRFVLRTADDETVLARLLAGAPA